MIVYNPKQPGVYKLENIYNSATDGDPQTSTKIVPAVGSIIIINTNLLKVVTYVNPDTLDSTLGDARFILADEDADVVNLGKDLLMLYFDKRQSPTRINVDNKLVLYGENSVGYRIIRTTSEGEEIVISAHLDEHNNLLNEIIPINVLPLDPPVSQCSNGHTLFDIEAGELLRMEVIDSAGVVTMEINLVSKAATILNTLEFASNPIIGFDADCSQVDGDDWIIYIDQNIEELAIFPYVTYADGSRRNLTIDNMVCYMYGYESINNSFPGNRYTIIIKYFLGKDELSTITEEVDGSRFVTLTKELYITSLDKFSYSKISILPIWNPGSSTYSLRFIGYHEERDDLTDITSTVSYVPGFVFNPALYNTQQEVRLSVEYTDENDNVLTFNQTSFLTVTAPNNSQPFLIRNTVDGLAYGAENALYNRPVLMYDNTLEGYFVPTSRFPDSETFLRNFYYAATPPWLVDTEIEPPVPTYFTIRDSASLRPLLSSPVEISNFGDIVTLLTLSTPNAYVNSTVIFEFLTYTSGSYNVLYGSPVEVLLSTTGYLG